MVTKIVLNDSSKKIQISELYDTAFKNAKFIVRLKGNSRDSRMNSLEILFNHEIYSKKDMMWIYTSFIRSFINYNGYSIHEIVKKSLEQGYEVFVFYSKKEFVEELHNIV